MPRFNEKEVKEINAIIADIQKAVDKLKTKKCLIGARDRTTIQLLLKSDGREDVKITTFRCQRPYSEAILQYFIDKGLERDKFSMNLQQCIYLLH